MDFAQLAHQNLSRTPKAEQIILPRWMNERLTWLMPTGQRHRAPCGWKDVRSSPLAHHPYLSFSAVILELGRQAVWELHSRLVVCVRSSSSRSIQAVPSPRCQHCLPEQPGQAWGVPAGLDPLHRETTAKTLQEKPQTSWEGLQSLLFSR